MKTVSRCCTKNFILISFNRHTNSHESQTHGLSLARVEIKQKPKKYTAQVLRVRSIQCD